MTDQTQDNKKFFVGQQVVTAIDYPEEGMVRYTIQYPNVKGELEDISETIPQSQWDAIKSETPYEDGKVAPKQWEGLLSETMAVFLKHKVRMGDLTFLIPQLKASFEENYKKATYKLWKRRHSDFVSLAQVDEILKSDTEMIED